MFTGLIQKVGKLKGLDRKGGSGVVTVSHEPWPEPVSEGESIAVQGACLTVARSTPGQFSCNLLGETLQKTNLGSLRVGSLLNLERAVKAGDRLGGHIVTGHVDGTGRVASCGESGGDRVLRIECGKDLLRGIVLKGSIACDGASLTVAALSETAFEVRIIPFTWEHTSLARLRKGGIVNIELDVLGKYAGSRHTEDGEHASVIDEKLLRNSGFL